MRFLHLKLRLVSPAIVVGRRTKFGFKIALNRIPATMLRGALLSSLFYHGVLEEEELKEQARDPSFLCTPGYPLMDGERSWPAHPFMYECKRCGKFYDDRENVLEQLERDEKPEVRYACEEDHLTLKTLHPNPVTKKGKRAVVESFTSASVGINKNRASFEGGMLYEYDAIGAGQEFWAYVACPGTVELEKGFTFWIGRGITRGFGEMKLEEVEELNIKEEAEKCRQAVKGQQLVMYTLSPFTAKILELDAIGKKMGIEAQGKLEVKKVYGREGKLNLGWDMLNNKRRGSLGGVALEGSVVVARITASATCEAIAGLFVLGIMEGYGEPICGINQVVPFRRAWE